MWVADYFSLRGFGSSRNPDISYYDRFDPPFAGPASANTISLDGGSLITTGWFSNSVQVLDAASGAVLQDLRTLAVPVNAVRFGDALAVAQVGAGNVIDARSGAVLLAKLAYPLGLATDGDTLYVSDWASGVVWAVSKGSSPGRLLPTCWLPKAWPSTAAVCSWSRRAGIESPPLTLRPVPLPP